MWAWESGGGMPVMAVASAVLMLQNTTTMLVSLLHMFRSEPGNHKSPPAGRKAHTPSPSDDTTYVKITAHENHLFVEEESPTYPTALTEWQ